MPVSLNDPIDGAELKRIILSRIEAALDRDCTLSDDIAYPGFELKFEVNLKYKRSSTPGTSVWAQAKEGDTEDAESVVLQDSYESDSPNQAREDHDLPIPFMEKTPNGEQRVKRPYRKHK